MGLTTSLFTGLSGLTGNSQAITVSGNNIANVNTTGFKASRVTFETSISQSLTDGSAPTAELGGTNPSQVGLGSRVATINRDFSDGSLQPTGLNTDMAVEGNGFFILDINGNRRFTRAGNFQLDRDFNLVGGGGGLVQGFGVDSDFKIVDGVVKNINIPLGSLTLAEPTTKVKFGGNLNGGGDAATVGSINTSGAMFSDNTATTPALATDDLTSLFDSNGVAMFPAGSVIKLTGATRGGATIPDHTFEVGAANTTGSDTNGTTLQDFMTFLDNVTGIDSTPDPSAGITVNGGGQLVVQGNIGTVNDLAIESGDITVLNGGVTTTPMTFLKTQDADGESVRTTFVGFDSLGQPMSIDLNVVLTGKSSSGTSWKFYAQSEADSDLDRVLGSGDLNFDTNGKLATATGNSIIIDRVGTGAQTPQSITLAFNEPAGAVSALADTTSNISAVSQDGTEIGTLRDFSVSNDGTIQGVFSNSLIRPLGRVALGNFANPLGLEDVGGNLFSATINSGNAAIVAPGTGGTGRVVGGALEQSNVDLSQEFINLISASTGFSASSRVLTTSDRLIQELLDSIR